MAKIPLSRADIPGVNGGDSIRELVNQVLTNQASSSMARARIGEPETTLRHPHGCQQSSALNTKRDNKITTKQRYVQGNPQTKRRQHGDKHRSGARLDRHGNLSQNGHGRTETLRNPLAANRKNPWGADELPRSHSTHQSTRNTQDTHQESKELAEGYTQADRETPQYG